MVKLTLAAVNGLDYEEFIEVFGNVIEHCPVIAAAVWSYRPFSTAEALHEAVCQVIQGFDIESRCQ